jgi:hypothetical protein
VAGHKSPSFMRLGRKSRAPSGVDFIRTIQNHELEIAHFHSDFRPENVLK